MTTFHADFTVMHSTSTHPHRRASERSTFRRSRSTTVTRFRTRLRRLPDRSRGHRPGREQGAARPATATSTPPRCTATRRASARRSAPPGATRGEVFVTSKLSNAAHRPDDARRAFNRTLTELGMDYVDLFLVHWPLPTLSWRRLRVDLEGARGVPRGWPRPARSACRTFRSSTWNVSSPRAATSCRPSTRSSCIRCSPTSGSAPTARSRGSPPRRGRRSPRARCSATRRSARSPTRSQDARAGRPAVAYPAGQHRLPEVGDARADRRRTSTLFDFELEPDVMARIDALDQGEAGRIGGHPDRFAFIPD